MISEDQARLLARVGPLFEGSRIALTLADAGLPDCPLIAVNPVFLESTGYDPQDVLGRNCRFLQPRGGAGPVKQQMRAFLDDPQAADGRFVVPNVRKDGTPFLNLVYLAKLDGASGSHFVLGSQFAFSLDHNRAALYDTALRENVQQIHGLFSQTGWSLLGSVDAVAGSMALLARHKLEHSG